MFSFFVVHFEKASHSPAAFGGSPIPSVKLHPLSTSFFHWGISRFQEELQGRNIITRRRRTVRAPQSVPGTASKKIERQSQQVPDPPCLGKVTLCQVHRPPLYEWQGVPWNYPHAPFEMGILSRRRGGCHSSLGACCAGAPWTCSTERGTRRKVALGQECHLGDSTAYYYSENSKLGRFLVWDRSRRLSLKTQHKFVFYKWDAPLSGTKPLGTVIVLDIGFPSSYSQIGTRCSLWKTEQRGKQELFSHKPSWQCSTKQ